MMDWGTILNTGISFLLGAGASAAISWFFYQRQLKDQHNRDEKAFNEQRKRDEQAHQQRLEDQKRAYEVKQHEREERDRQLQRTRMYDKRLATFRDYDRTTGWEVYPHSDGSNQVTIQNLTGKDFLTLEVHLPFNESDYSAYRNHKPITSFHDMKAGSKFTITLTETVDDMEFIEFRGYPSGTSAPYRERVPLDPNVTMPEYRNQR